MLKVLPEGDLPPVSENITLPTFLDEESRANVLGFHDWVTESNVEIYVPSSFGTMVALLRTEGAVYHGGYEPYIFYFDTEEARTDFLTRYDEL